MGRRVRLGQAVTPQGRLAPEDLRQVRWALSRLGLYDPALDPGPWSHDRMTRGLRAAIAELQDRQGLKRDALLQPGGPTEKRLNFLLTAYDDPSMHRDLHDINGRPIAERLAAFEAEKRRETDPGVLAGRVGPGLENHPRDVRAAKTLLARHGLLPEAELGAAIARPGDTLFAALERFQQHGGLTVDGIMVPEGETEQALGRMPRVPPAPATTAGRASPFALPPAPVPQAIRELLQSFADETSPVPSVLRDLAGPGGLEVSSRPLGGTGLLQALFRQPGGPSLSDGPQGAPAGKVPPVPEPKPRRVPPVPTRKPDLHEGPTVPSYKRQTVPSSELALWETLLEKAGIAGRARNAFIETFIAEGGFDSTMEDENTGEPAGTVVGLTQVAIAEAGPKIGIPADTKSVDLTNEQRVDLYKAFIGQPHYLGKFGGIDALEQIADEHLAYVLFDTLFVHGSGEGSAVIQKAINKVDPENPVAVDGVMGSETFEAYKAIADDEDKRQALLDALAEERPKAKSPPVHDPERYQHFRFIEPE